MTFWEIFVRVLPRRPFSALLALYWHLTGRRLRARNRLRVAGARLSFAYSFWQSKIEPEKELSARNAQEILRWSSRPTFSILLMKDFGQSESAIRRSIQSIEAQTYRHYSVVIPELEDSFSCATTLQRTLHDTDADFIVPLRAGTELSSSALHHFANASQDAGTPAIIYGDQDELDASGIRKHPWFKPDWNEELFLAQDYLSDAVAINVELARSAIDRSSLTSRDCVYELLLLLAKDSSAVVVHVPHITAHVPTPARPRQQQDRVALVAKHLKATGAAARSGPFGTVSVSWPLPSEPPLVSIIIPTKDKVELLSACVDTLLGQTSYRPFEVLVIDNGSVQKRTLDYLSKLESHGNVRVLSYAGAYNFSAINNYAAAQASGNYLCLLNNDTEIVETEWLTELMRYAVRPDIGAAGAKLLYADGRIQHAGVIVGIGDAAGHPHRNLPANEEGYFALTHAAQFVSAVTGACLVVDKRKFMAVGGLDEDCLAVAYNDVDLCLKLERAGWRNVYVPRAVLVHHESKSRGRDHSRSQIDRYRRELKTFQERWDTPNYVDPQFNPNLDRSSETFIIGL